MRTTSPASSTRKPARADAGAELVVVGEGFEERGEAADGGEGVGAHGERGAEAEVEAVLEQAGGEDAGEELGRDAEGFKAGPEGDAAARVSVGCADVGGGDHADREAGLFSAERDRVGRACAGAARPAWNGRTKGLHDLSEVGRCNEDVGVVDEEVGVLGVGEELDEGGDLAGGAEVLGAKDEAEVDVGVEGGEVGDDAGGGVVRGADAAEDLEGAGVVLEAVGLERGTEGVVCAAEGFEEGDAGGRGIGWEDGVEVAEVVREAAGAKQCERGVDEAADGEERQRELDEVEQHEGSLVGCAGLIARSGGSERERRASRRVRAESSSG